MRKIKNKLRKALIETITVLADTVYECNTVNGQFDDPEIQVEYKELRSMIEELKDEEDI